MGEAEKPKGKFGGKGSAGAKPGVSQVKSDVVKRIQAQAMLRDMVLNGGNTAATAAKFNTSRAIVRSRLSYAQRAGLFTQHEDVILAGMVPRAESVLMNFLEPEFAQAEDGTAVQLRPTIEQANIAVKVFSGTGLFRKPGTTAPAAAAAGGKEGETLESYIAKLRASDAWDIAATLPEEAFDAEYSESGEPAGSVGQPAGKLLPSGTESGDSHRAAGPDGQLAETTLPPTGNALEAPGASDVGHPEHLREEIEPGPGPAVEGDNGAAELQDALPGTGQE